MSRHIPLAIALCAAVLPAGARNVYWYSVSAANLDSAGAAMSGGFSFELGVFQGDFVPCAANRDQWAANWVPAQRVAYHATDQRFTGGFTVTANPPPFTVGKAAYVWGFIGGTASSEWILFRAPDWTWPQPDPLNPVPLFWNAADATPVAGTIHAAGTPFLMQSAAVTDAASPPTTWDQWRAAELAGEPLDGPNDDPDRDGTDNLLEFVFGTPPTRAGPPPQMPVALAGGFLQVTIPRRIDHPALLTVETSPDLTAWAAGPGATVVVADGPAALVVRDLTPLGPGVPRRFMRLRADLAGR